jgi:outer membrane protein W
VVPQLTLGVFGAATEFEQTNQQLSTTNVRSLTAGAQAQWFFRPYHVVNPWVSLGSAYRGFWTVPEVGGITSRQGWQIARLQIGADMRATREVSVGPYIGGSVDTFFTEKVPGGNWRNLSGPPVSIFIQAGLVGRFDLGGTYTQRASIIASR